MFPVKIAFREILIIFIREIHRCFVSRNVNLLVRAFTVYVCPLLLEYNSVIWSPLLKQSQCKKLISV